MSSPYIHKGKIMMQLRPFVSILFASLLACVMTASHAGDSRALQRNPHPVISFISFPSLDALTQQPVTVKGKLVIPAGRYTRQMHARFSKGRPAVLILHGSAGVDSRGEFYARALNAAGMATLEIDMWEARGVTDLATRPSHPISTYPDAFAALAFLSAYPGIDPGRIGVMGFSWGGVITMASATQGIASQFGGTLRFKAHVANYPVCYVYNNPAIPYSQFGSKASNPLTGAPILIQIGEEDDYDEGTAPCFSLKASLDEQEQAYIDVIPYAGAYHGWDRLQVPVTDEDPFAHRGAGGTVEIKPSVDQAYQSRNITVRFFQKNL